MLHPRSSQARSVRRRTGVIWRFQVRASIVRAFRCRPAYGQDYAGGRRGRAHLSAAQSGDRGGSFGSGAVYSCAHRLPPSRGRAADPIGNGIPVLRAAPYSNLSRLTYFAGPSCAILDEHRSSPSLRAHFFFSPCAASLLQTPCGLRAIATCIYLQAQRQPRDGVCARVRSVHRPDSAGHCPKYSYFTTAFSASPRSQRNALSCH